MWFFGWQHEVSLGFALPGTPVRPRVGLLMACWLWFRRKQLKLTPWEALPHSTIRTQKRWQPETPIKEILMTRAHEKLNYVEFAARGSCRHPGLLYCRLWLAVHRLRPRLLRLRRAGWRLLPRRYVQSQPSGAPCWCSTAPISRQPRPRCSTMAASSTARCLTSPVAAVSTLSSPAAMSLRSGRTGGLIARVGTPAHPALCFTFEPFPGAGCPPVSFSPIAALTSIVFCNCCPVSPVCGGHTGPWKLQGGSDAVPRDRDCQLDAKPEFSDRFRAALDPLIAAALQEPGCLRYQLHQSLESPTAGCCTRVGERGRPARPPAAAPLYRLCQPGLPWFASRIVSRYRRV